MNLFGVLGRVLRCAHPMILSRTDEDFPFFSGSCFTVHHHGRLFVLTALHCLRDVEVRITRIACGGRENEHFPLKRWTYFDSTDFADSDSGDIAIFEVDMER